MLDVAARIAGFLETKFPNNTIAADHYGDLLIPYAQSGLAPPHMQSELETGDEGKFWSSVWEAMLYRHLRALGYALRNNATSSGQNGPDFCFAHGTSTIWVEAIVPSPEGIPADYLEPPGKEIRVKTKPDKERVLRCTSAIADKTQKFADYVRKGNVAPHDVVIIALNICRLSDWDVDGNGISQLPLALEAVFPVGPLGVPITPDGQLAGQAHNIPRFSVAKASGLDIQTYNFLDSKFAGISAVLQGHQKDIYNKPLVLSAMHNPLATAPCPRALFGAYKEFVATENPDGYALRDVAQHSANAYNSEIST